MSMNQENIYKLITSHALYRYNLSKYTSSMQSRIFKTRQVINCVNANASVETQTRTHTLAQVTQARTWVCRSIDTQLFYKKVDL